MDIAAGSPTILSADGIQAPVPPPPAADTTSGTSSGNRGSGGGSPPPPQDGPEWSPELTAPGQEPVAARAAESLPPARDQPPGPPPAGPGPSGGRRRPWYAALVLAALVVGVIAVVILTSSSSTPKGKLSSSTLAQVPTNKVTGTGSATVRLNGNVAAVTVTTNGLDSNAALAHAMHIHAGAKGECPPASAARRHNGHLAISTTDGINYYGPPVQALTTRGDTSPASILAFPRFLTGGTLHYTRTITLPPAVAADIRRDNAVIVVHGIDYDGSGIYDGVLDRSELDTALPGTATAPALCGRLVGAQQAAVRHPRSGVRARVYTASLAKTTLSAGELFLCEVGEAPSAVADGPAADEREGDGLGTAQAELEPLLRRPSRPGPHWRIRRSSVCSAKAAWGRSTRRQLPTAREWRSSS